MPTQIQQPAPTAGLRRSLNVWQAVGLSVALMAPSMASNINPQASVPSVGRAVPLAFLLAAVGVLLVAYVFVRLCQYFNHSGSVYAFVGATLGPRTGVVAGWGLLGTYIFYGVTTSSVVGIFGTNFLQNIHVWSNPPTRAPYILTAVALVLCWLLTAVPVRRGTNVLLVVEGATVALILLVSAVVAVKLLSHSAPGGHQFTMSVFTVPHGTGVSAVFLGIVFGFLSFAGFEAASTLGEEAADPHRDIPRAILGTAIFGGIFFVVVTAIESMGFGTDDKGVAAFGASQSLIGDLGTSYVGSWVGNAITLGAMISAFGCCLACTVGSARLLFALNRDGFGERGLGRLSRIGTPARSGGVVVTIMAATIAISILGFSAVPENTFAWGGTIGTLILLVAYILTTVGAIRLFFVQRRMQVPAWQVVIPLAAIVLLGYTLYRNVIPYPAWGSSTFWLPVVSGGWLLIGILAVVAAPTTARRMGEKLTEVEGIAAAKASGTAQPLVDSVVLEGGTG
ncbi:APC family permease [Actinocrinis puniceicyclus]|uniref:APC family permease n=1 Tax=Actinocrinis puniceicyclus TaxID=977794 RepID=A0A8J7WIE6_9ACTN|nr:APC family permease [Actinocrinis puniceicyclus]MBS2962881.1 APC family permease [Actinocrinis puniceicyclus]